MARLSVLFLFGVSVLCGIAVSLSNGVRSDEELNSQAIPVEAMSQCADQRFCDDSTPGTGHERGLFSDLTDSIVAVEQCYSHCFSQLDASEADFSSEPFPEVYRLEGSCSDAYVCALACSLSLPTSASLLRNITQLSQSATCSELCTAENGICDRAFPTAPECAMQCREGSMCTNLCTEFESEIPVSPGQGVPDPVSSPVNLMYAEDFDLARQGVLEFTLPDQQPDGTAYGVIWRVQYDNGQNTVEEYIPQHLPFHLLPTEVGPLYRVGSNMLSIRQLQCLPGVNLSYALVNAVGVSEFSEPQEQCFYGNAFPQPPSGIHVRFGFVELMAELELEVWVDQPSTDADVVTAYGLQVFTLGPSGVLSPNNEALFPDKNDLHLVVNGTSEVEMFLPTYHKNTTYLFGVFALPQARMTMSGRAIYPASNWVKVHADFPEHPLLNGTECYSVKRDHITGLANITVQFKVHSGWKSLVTVATIEGDLAITAPRKFSFLPEMNVSVLTFSHDEISIKPAQSVYTFSYHDARPSFDKEFFLFKKGFTGRFQKVLYPQIAGNDLVFLVQPLPASPVINLKACYTFIRDNQSSVFSVDVQWEAPMWPEGEVEEYEVFVNSSVVVEDKVKNSNYSFELPSDADEQGQPMAVWVRAVSTIQLIGGTKMTPGKWVMVSLLLQGQSQLANSGLQCISSSSQTRQEPPEEIESDLCGIFAPVNATPTPTIPSNNIAILPSMVTAVVGLVCVLGTLLLFH